METAAQPLYAHSPDTFGRNGTSLVPERLEAEVLAIYSSGPLYTSRFPLHAERLHWSCFNEIPVLTKKEIVERGHCAFFDDCGEVDAAVQRNEFEYESTSGTTSGPMTVIMENGWWDEQTRRAYAASPILAQFAGKPHRKAVLAPVGCSSNLCPYSDFEFPQRYFNGTAYLNLSSDPFAFSEAEWDRIVVETQAVKPDILEGEPVYLSLLARAVLKRKVTIPSLKAVILTYGKASLQHSKRIMEAFPAPQVDLYGSTEAGYIFVGEAFKDDSQVIDGNVFVELRPFREGLLDVYQIVVTTRARKAMPLLRYLTGDVVQRFPTGFRLLGRERDMFFRPDGSLLTTADVDRAFPEDFKCWHYSLTQVSENRWTLDYVADHTAKPEVAEAVAAAIGPGTRVAAFRRRIIPPAASGKFSLLKPLAPTA
jgi:phenylacetate-CoA ligase